MAVLHQRFLVDGRVETPGQVISDGAYREAKLRQLVNFTVEHNKTYIEINSIIKKKTYLFTSIREIRLA